ncbi:hypothetical protein [Thermus amyloliquefaciens]|uniref:hypothetical protein n=1 Tax=Thermus amyloliquefaciens TaxID=1449080 RepID=UPI000571DA7C|nr:hypothetical protein [Thermus amyloliquefaciens]
MRWLGVFLLLALGGWARGEEGPWGLGPPPEEVRERCFAVVRTLEVQALYREGDTLVLVLGRAAKESPLLLLALEGGRPMPHMGPIRGKPVRMRPFFFLQELSLARRVVALPGEYRCFVLHRGRVVGVLRLGLDLTPLPLPPGNALPYPDPSQRAP